MPSAIPTSTSDAPRNTWCCPASTAPRRRSPPVSLQLVATDAETTHLEVVAELQRPASDAASQEQVLELLAPGVVLTRAKLRDTLGVKNERLGEALESLERAGRLRRTPTGWRRLD